jgi:hypothetical protein
MKAQNAALMQRLCKKLFACFFFYLIYMYMNLSPGLINQNYHKILSLETKCDVEYDQIYTRKGTMSR